MVLGGQRGCPYTRLYQEEHEDIRERVSDGQNPGWRGSNLGDELRTGCFRPAQCPMANASFADLTDSSRQPQAGMAWLEQIPRLAPKVPAQLGEGPQGDGLAGGVQPIERRLAWSLRLSPMALPVCTP